jgi:hypothetical protein
MTTTHYNTLTNTTKTILGTILWFAVLSIAFLTLKGTSSAATINVVAGTDGIEENNQCQLSEAIQNINDQAQTNDDCPAGDGNDDTINLPAGTITLSADLPEITQSVTIQGQGMGQTTISGDSGNDQMFQINIGSPEVCLV